MAVCLPHPFEGLDLQTLTKHLEKTCIKHESGLVLKIRIIIIIIDKTYISLDHLLDHITCRKKWEKIITKKKKIILPEILLFGPFIRSSVSDLQQLCWVSWWVKGSGIHPTSCCQFTVLKTKTSGTGRLQAGGTSSRLQSAPSCSSIAS